MVLRRLSANLWRSIRSSKNLQMDSMRCDEIRRDRSAWGWKVLLAAPRACAFLFPLFAGFVCSPALRAQTATARPVFAVASVKLHVTPPGGGIDGLGVLPRRSGDRVRWTNVPLQLVALYAYGIPAFRLSGSLLRTFDDTYDIDAIA